jgi:hypothetical protein
MLCAEQAERKRPACTVAKAAEKHLQCGLRIFIIPEVARLATLFLRFHRILL